MELQTVLSIITALTGSIDLIGFFVGFSVSLLAFVYIFCRRK